MAFFAPLQIEQEWKGPEKLKQRDVIIIKDIHFISCHESRINYQVRLNVTYIVPNLAGKRKNVKKKKENVLL